MRINLYARIARIGSGADIDALGEELEDRFGAVPQEAQALLAAARIRHLARLARVARVDAGPAAIALTPRPDFAAKAPDLEAKGERLLLREPTELGEQRLDRVRALLDRLVPEAG